MPESWSPGLLSGFLLAAGLSLSVACALLEPDEEAPAQLPQFQLTLHVAQEDQLDIAGAKILQGETVLGTTKEDGTTLITLQGQEGARVPLKVQCPEPYQSPGKPIVVGLRPLAPGSPPPKFSATCIRAFQTVVVGIRAENGNDLPIVRLGQEVARTDVWGVAHVLLEAAPNEQVSLTMDTSEQRLLRPQNPTLTFVTGNKDELILLDQKFSRLRVKRKPKPVVKRPTPL